MYQALYRKYRPKSFDDVVDQKYIIETLKNSILNDKISHAYMFFGPRGIGKTTVAKIFARAVNCTNNSNGNPCEKCDSCIASAEKECVDIIEIDAASNNGVDEIREIKSKVNLVPNSLKYKVYIIDEVHMLTAGAFNALLKTLEEPPKHVIFILATTDPQKVSSTIISRCQCFSFKRISDDCNVNRLREISDLEKIEIDDETLKQISIYSDGGLRDSLSTLDKLSSYKNGKITVEDFYEINDMISKSDLEDFYKIIISTDIKQMILKLDKFYASGKNIVEIMNQFLIFLKDKIVDYYLSGTNIDVYRTEKLLVKLNENMFELKKASKPYIYVEILLLDYINSIGNSNKIISREIISNDESLENSSTSVNENSIAEVDGGSDSVDKVNDEPNSIDDSINVDESVNEEKNVSIGSNAVESDLDYLHKLMSVRVHNVLALASKVEKNADLVKINGLNDYVFDQKIGYIVSEILNGTLRASSENGMIISYEYQSVVDQNLNNLESIMEVYSKITTTDKKIVFITDEEWENEKKKYIEFTKSGNKYKIEEEPVVEAKTIVDTPEVQESKSNFADFGDIVEIN
jgi:hypothetical protein